MSNWIHINANFRIDSIRPILPEPDLDAIFGKICSYESLWENRDELEKHPENFLPFGSDGSCDINMWTNPNENHMAAYNISVFGDLKDCNQTEPAVDWFINSLKKVIKTYPIRQAVITVERDSDGYIQTATVTDENKVYVTSYSKDGSDIRTDIKYI